MARPPEPIYLARQTYRRRRLEDAARFLPWLGAILLVFPALWAGGGTADPAGTAPRGLFIFLAWGGLVMLAALLSRRLTQPPEAETTPESGPGRAEDAP